MLKTKEVQLRKNQELLKCDDEIRRIHNRMAEVKKSIWTSSDEGSKLEERITALHGASRTGLLFCGVQLSFFQTVQKIAFHSSILRIAVGHIKLSPALQREYHDLKVDADEQTYDDQKELKKAQELLQSTGERLGLLRDQVNQIEEQKDTLNSEFNSVRCF